MEYIESPVEVCTMDGIFSKTTQTPQGQWRGIRQSKPTQRQAALDRQAAFAFPFERKQTSRDLSSLQFATLRW
jgi:hypothetical protein